MIYILRFLGSMSECYDAWSKVPRHWERQTLCVRLQMIDSNE